MAASDDDKPTATSSPPWGWARYRNPEIERLAARLNRLLAEARTLREMEELGVPAIAKPKEN